MVHQGEAVPTNAGSYAQVFPMAGFSEPRSRVQTGDDKGSERHCPDRGKKLWSCAEGSENYRQSEWSKELQHTSVIPIAISWFLYYIRRADGMVVQKPNDKILKLKGSSQTVATS